MGAGLRPESESDGPATGPYTPTRQPSTLPTVKILELMGQRARQARPCEGPGATPRARSGPVHLGRRRPREGRRIALFFSGRQHAGENLKDVLEQRAAELAPPIQMCDALSRNLPGELKTILANCLAHGRRQFVDVAERFPEECRHVLESLAVVYRNDAIARKQELSPDGASGVPPGRKRPDDGGASRLAHPAVRRPAGRAQLVAGRGITYMLKHWEKLTLFLRRPGPRWTTTSANGR